MYCGILSWPLDGDLAHIFHIRDYFVLCFWQIQEKYILIKLHLYPTLCFGAYGTKGTQKSSPSSFLDSSRDGQKN